MDLLAIRKERERDSDSDSDSDGLLHTRMIMVIAMNTKQCKFTNKTIQLPPRRAEAHTHAHQP
jgi:hypothetical protein